MMPQTFSVTEVGSDGDMNIRVFSVWVNDSGDVVVGDPEDHETAASVLTMSPLTAIRFATALQRASRFAAGEAVSAALVLKDELTG